MTDTLIRPAELTDDRQQSDAPPARRTSLPAAVPATAPGAGSDERVEVRTATFGEKFDLGGALAGGAALGALIFGWFSPLQGAIGWAVVSYALFLGIYVLMVRMDSSPEEVKDKVTTVLFASAGVLVFGVLILVVVFTLIRGMNALVHLNFFTHTMRQAGPLEGLEVGGIAHAAVGTLIQISIALVITIPLGLGTAVFLNEVGGRFAKFVRTVSDAMTALPSIVAGLFVYAFLIQGITGERSGFAASVAITVMMLPIVIRSADVVLRLVPQNLREAAYAMGATRWRTVWYVVLPTARSGLVTAVILGAARGIGETSPVLLTSGVTATMNTNPFAGPMISLPLQVFDFVRSPSENMIARGFGAAAVLMLLVLVLFMAARAIGGRAPGELTRRGAKAVRTHSLRDLQRINAAANLTPARASGADLPESPRSPIDQE